jgi:hypothetical protein
MATRSELLRAYAATTYRIFLPDGAADLRLDQASEPLCYWLEKTGLRSFAILTAHNPASVLFTAIENAQFQLALRADLQVGEHRVFGGENLADEAGWPPEESCCVFDLPLSAAAELGRKYGQNAILFGGQDAIPRLYWMEEIK